jgi:hypothetical protein
MISTSEQRVLIRIPIEPAIMRTVYGDVKCFRLSQGFCSAEYADGNIFPISNPLELFVLDQINNAGTASGNDVMVLYFKFEPLGPPSNPDRDDNERSFQDLQSYLG